MWEIANLLQPKLHPVQYWDPFRGRRGSLCSWMEMEDSGKDLPCARDVQADNKQKLL